MTSSPTGEPTTAWEPAQRTRIRAFRAGRNVLIVAEGDLPTPGHDVDIQQSPRRVFPQQYDLVRRQRPGGWPDVLLPYRHAETFLYPTDQPSVTVHHADGQDAVAIEECGEELAPFAAAVGEQSAADARSGVPEATGMSRQLSFDEAFADALAKLSTSLEAQHPDAMTSVHVVEIGGLFGGIAGFHHLFVRIRGGSD